MEDWCVIEEAPNYLVSNQGRVVNQTTGKILKPGLAGIGYSFVNLSNNGLRFNRYVHRLVGEAFVYRDNPSLEINHIDGDKTNNCFWNLEWVTSAENSQHASQTGLIGKRVRIIETGEIFQSLTYCANAIGGDPQNISHCLSGRRKKHRGYTFEWV